MAKAMKEISSGAQKWEGQKWFTELSDKRMSFSKYLVSIVSKCHFCNHRITILYSHRIMLLVKFRNEIFLRTM